VLATAQLFCLSVPAQDTVTVADKQIMQEIREHNELMNNLEYLSDVIGPRVTGTEQLNQAVNWAQDLCHRYKLGNVHRESWKIGHSWQRGAAVARIVNPVSRSLTIASSGWSPATRGTVRGNVMYVPAVHAEELQFYRGKLRGAIVIYQQLVNLSPQPFVTGSAPPPIQTPAPVPDRTSPSPEAAFNSARMAFFKNWKNPDSPRGPIMIDPETRDIIQNIYVRKVEKVDGELYNVEFATIPNVKDPVKAAAKK